MGNAQTMGTTIRSDNCPQHYRPLKLGLTGLRRVLRNRIVNHDRGGDSVPDMENSSSISAVSSNTETNAVTCPNTAAAAGANPRSYTSSVGGSHQLRERVSQLPGLRQLQVRRDHCRRHRQFGWFSRYSHGWRSKLLCRGLWQRPLRCLHLVCVSTSTSSMWLAQSRWWHIVANRHNRAF